jgi:hypothetical protein
MNSRDDAFVFDSRVFVSLVPKTLVSSFWRLGRCLDGVAEGNGDKERASGAEWPTELGNDETRVEVKKKGGRMYRQRQMGEEKKKNIALGSLRRPVR